ncbi:hypothetical protein N9948_01570 [bacterium]|nr:hypothetical protein [bacterium]
MGIRKAYNDCEFIVDKKEGLFHGLSFGWDFTADHEWGTEGIEKSFGLKKTDWKGTPVLGVKRTRINKVPENLHFFKSISGGENYTNLVLINLHKDDFRNYKPEGTPSEDFSVSWCDDRFSISVRGKDNINAKYLKELHEAILKKDVSYIWTNKTNDKGIKISSRTSPTLLITSRLDREFVQNIYDYDLDQKNLAEAFEATGIEEFLKENKKSWYALKPSWKETIAETTDGRKIKTDHPVIIWLNPREQKESNSGWYTVEDLKLWPKGVGPVPKNKDSNAKDFILAE